MKNAFENEIQANFMAIFFECVDSEKCMFKFFSRECIAQNSILDLIHAFTQVDAYTLTHTHTHTQPYQLSLNNNCKLAKLLFLSER